MDATDRDNPAARNTGFLRRIASPLAFYFLFVAIIILRRPDCITHSQFWAEDGWRFFPEAFERDFWANLFSYSYGYFDFLLRLTHQFATLFPLEQAPRVLAICAILIQASVPSFVISRRAEWMGAFPIRLAAALLYCALPNSFEVHAIALHSRVHLALLAALVIVSRPPETRPAKFFDAVVLILSGLSGPFVLILAPAAFWRYATERSAPLKRNALIMLGVLLAGIFALLTSSSQRFVGELGLSVSNFVRIVGGQITISFLFGEGTYAAILGKPWFDAAAWCSFGVLVFLLAVVVRYGRREIHCLLFIGFGFLAMALSAPLAGFDRSHWDALWTVPGCGQRYYAPLMGSLLFAIASMAGDARVRWRRFLGIGFLLLIGGMGARVDFILPPFTDYGYAKKARAYSELPPGGVLVVPINPPTWKMELHKPAD